MAENNRLAETRKERISEIDARARPATVAS